jgi:hypothetical protein
MKFGCSTNPWNLHRPWVGSSSLYVCCLCVCVCVFIYPSSVNFLRIYSNMRTHTKFSSLCPYTICTKKGEVSSFVRQLFCPCVLVPLARIPSEGQVLWHLPPWQIVCVWLRPPPLYNQVYMYTHTHTHRDTHTPWHTHTHIHTHNLM